MNEKKIYESPKMEVIYFDNDAWGSVITTSDNMGVDTQSYTKTDYSDM